MSLAMTALATLAAPVLSRRFASAQAMDAAVRKPRPDPPPPARLRRSCRTSERTVEGTSVWDVTPQPSEAEHAVLYLHGGAYTFPISTVHWSFVADVTSSAAAHVCVPLYGLAPEHTYRDAYPLVEQAFAELAERFGADRVTIMGDSAGGGLALGLARLLRDRGVTPRQVILISPWLDLTLSHPRIAESGARDPWLKRPGLVRAGQLWAGGDDPSDPRLSPMRGSISGLPPLTIYIGDRDLFLPDAEEFAEQAAAAGQAIDLIVQPGALHVYPLLPAPEGRRARAEIIRRVAH